MQVHAHFLNICIVNIVFKACFGLEICDRLGLGLGGLTTLVVLE